MLLCLPGRAARKQACAKRRSSKPGCGKLAASLAGNPKAKVKDKGKLLKGGVPGARVSFSHAIKFLLAQFVARFEQMQHQCAYSNKRAAAH